MKRATVALSFASASLGEAIDVLDPEDEWAGPCQAALTGVLLMEFELDGELARRPAMERGIFLCN